MDKAARKAASNPNELSFTEAIDLLCNAAQTFDEGNQQRRRPRFSRSANIHQLDDDEDPIDDDEEEYDHQEASQVQHVAQNQRVYQDQRRKEGGTRPWQGSQSQSLVVTIQRIQDQVCLKDP